jgi:hypothetical protein
MALSIISPQHSFVRFGESTPDPLCIWGNINFCLPIYAEDDWYFQFVVQGTETEIDSLCTQTGEEISVSLVSDCDGEPLITFTELPERFRLSATQVLYNWNRGFPAFDTVVAIGECFKVQVIVTGGAYGYEESITKCSNCFERIASDCFTSVVEYGNDEDAFGFKYCYGGNIPGSNDSTIDCDPTIVTFVSVATLSIPYTALLSDKYGEFPTVQVWIYDGTGQLINMGITAAFDTYPPNMINLDFGGPASGIVVIR